MLNLLKPADSDPLEHAPSFLWQEPSCDLLLIEIALAHVEADGHEASRTAKPISGLADCRNTHFLGADKIASRVQKREVSFSGEEASDEDEESDNTGGEKRESHECL